MRLPEFLQRTPLDSTLLLGFYGGGNYGDELLMEVLAGLLKKRGAKDVSIAYQHPEHYDTVHHDFGYPRVNMHDKKALLAAMLKRKNIVVGGGGLWGMDVNLNVLLMSLMLFFGRWVLGKKIYLVAVGYYDSAPRLGRIAAWLAAKAAHHILARDKETYHNFSCIQAHTSLDQDIAWYTKELDLTTYKTDVEQLEKRLHVSEKTVFITLRRFKDEAHNHLQKLTAAVLEQNKEKRIIVALLEPRHIDPAGYKKLQQWQQEHPAVQIIDFNFNPLALFLFFRKHQAQLAYIGPQFHAILSAHLTGVPYLPLAYDNKVHNLLGTIAPQASPLTMETVRLHHLQHFIDRWYNARPA